jgi:hypothetical protein
MPPTYPTERSISPRSSTKTTPKAIVAMGAICVIRLLKFVAPTKFEFLK